jgi:nucleoside-diphosphate-sugar epimerase
MNKKILVTGGAGYIGSVVSRLLLKEGFDVTVVDILNFGGESIVELMNDPHFNFIKCDIRNFAEMEKHIAGMDVIVHLAAIVGDPACAKEPELSVETNVTATKELYNLANKLHINHFVYASTCSNYGKMSDPDVFITEESELSPLSIYAKTKVESEMFLLSQPDSNFCIPTCLRFSTVYGLSPRIRFDLTVNEFTKELAMKRELVIFGEQFWRPYCHVLDLARAVLTVILAGREKVAFNVFNVGDTSENYTKQMLVEEISKQIPDARVKYVKKNEDPRDYRVSFEKIRQELGYGITMRVPEGISQVKQVIEDGFLLNPDDTKYRNI